MRPIRVSSPLVRDIHGADDLAMAAARLTEAEGQATGREPSGASLVVVTERLGHAAASVMPPKQGRSVRAMLSRRRTNA